ncbi:MAG: PAS domain S-box protein, partial [Chloroflexota bacterium]
PTRNGLQWTAPRRFPWLPFLVGGVAAVVLVFSVASVVERTVLAGAPQAALSMFYVARGAALASVVLVLALVLLIRLQREAWEAATTSQTLVSAVPDAMLVVDDAGRILHCNDRAESIFGYRREELLGQPVELLVPERYRDAHLPHRMSYMAAPTARPMGVGLSLVGRRKDGSEFPTDVSLGPYSARGESLVIAVVRDVTARKQAAEKLAILSHAVEQTADNVIIADKNGFIQYVNPAFEATTGYSREDVIGKTSRILKSGYHDPAFYERLWKTILAGETFRAVLANRKKNGDLYYADKAITPIKDERGEITHFVSTERDVTARKRAEERILFQAQVLWSVRDGVIATDLEGKILYWNEGATHIFGYSAEELVGASTEILYGDTAQFAADAASILAGNDSVEERRGRRKDGSEVWVDISTTMMRDARGQPAGFLEVAKDITERRRLEAESRGATEAFQQEVVELLARAAEAKDDVTGTHLTRMRAWVEGVATEMGLPSDQVAEMARACILHDIGKLHVPDAILLKPGPLTPEEWEVMKMHPFYGEQILFRSPTMKLAAVIARNHHERWDGSGYPDGKREDGIPQAARIVAVVDTFDALITRRPYKAAWPAEAALRELQQTRGKTLDPAVVDAFVSMFEKGAVAEILARYPV